MCFLKKRKALNSDEYIQLFKTLNELKISIETIKLEFELYKKKVRIKANLDESDKSDKEKDIYNSVIIPE